MTWPPSYLTAEVMAKVGPLRESFQPPTAHEQLHYLMQDEGQKVIADVLGAATEEIARGGGEVADGGGAHAAALAPLAPVLRRLLDQRGGGAKRCRTRGLELGGGRPV